MYVEGIVAPPRPTADDSSRFASELATAKACGADCVRMALMNGRRYEVFTKADDYTAFAKRAALAVRTAEPMARKHKVRLGAENHKDFRTDELLDLVKGVGSEYLGVCVDLGNNLALVEDPAATIAALAPYAITVHMKDIGVETAEDGFRMTEVPLGEGVIDVAGAVAALRKAKPRVRLNLEMITRDPLSIPCLTDRYWATLGRVPARDLARTLVLVRKAARKKPMPRISTLAEAARLRVEDQNVRASLAHAAAAKWGGG
jgi:sugar phosphate isomerase/epimerase